MDNKSKWISLLLSSDGFVVINKALIKVLGLNAAVLIGELVSEYNYYEKVDKLVDDTWFYSTSANIEENTGLTRYAQDESIKKLIKLKIIETKVMGIPSKKYFKLVFENIEKLIINADNKNGYQKSDKKPLKSQVAEISNLDCQDQQESLSTDKKNIQKDICNNENDYQINAEKPQKSQVVEISNLVCRNQQPCLPKTAINNNNKTIINNSNNISNLISSEQGVGKDKMRSDILFENFKKNIDFDILLEECETKPSKKGPLENILSIIKDLYKLKENEYIRVSGRKVYASEIQKLLNEYNIDYINYVLESLSNNFSDIKNIKAYVITTLINAPKTINLFYQGKANNDSRKNIRQRERNGIFIENEKEDEYNPLEFSIERINEFKNLTPTEIKNRHHSPPVPA